MTATTPGPRELADALLKRTSWSPDELAEHQTRALEALLRHAVTASPYYRRMLGPDAVDAPLAQLPTLSKATLMEHFDEIVTDSRLGRARLEAHLTGPRASQPLDGYRVLSTAGSTGFRGIFVYSEEEMSAGVAAMLRTMRLFGITPGMRVAGVGAADPVHISRHLIAGVTGQLPDAARTSAADPLPHLVEVFNTAAPDVLFGYPSMHALLAEEQLAGRLHIAPRTVVYAGEVMSEDMRARISAAWGVTPHSLYSATEVAMIASSCSARVGMHLWEDLVLVEVVDEHDRPVPAGVLGHKILITNLFSRAQPLIRYEISDSVALSEGPNPTGWPFRRITAVEGRSDDIVHLAAAGGGTVAVHPVHLRAPFGGFPEIVQYQIVHDSTGIEVLIVQRPGADRETPERIRDALARRLRTAGALPPPITVTPVTRIDRGSSHATKFAIVRSRRS
jgi:putative adenylate-forming enzyme